MPKETKEPVELSEVTTPLAPASYELVGINPDDKSIHVPLVSRDYVVAELRERLDILEMLHGLGWPHVKKN